MNVLCKSLFTTIEYVCPYACAYHCMAELELEETFHAEWQRRQTKSVAMFLQHAHHNNM